MNKVQLLSSVKVQKQSGTAPVLVHVDLTSLEVSEAGDLTFYLSHMHLFPAGSVANNC